MNIGIFGCSSAVEHYSFFPNTTIPYHSWSYLIKEKYSTVENFAQGGSSLYFSYKNWLLNQHKKFDKTIFIVTDPHRWYLPNLPDQCKHISGVQHLEHLVEKATDPYIKKVYESLINYEVYAKNLEFYSDMHNLMVSVILSQQGPDFLVLPMTENGIPNWKGDFLKPIFWLDVHFYKVYDWGNKDRRKCHMNRENNKIFSNRVIDWIETGNIDFGIQHFVTSAYPEHYYFY
jgi:hypothetical protein